MPLKSGFHFVDLGVAGPGTDMAAATAVTNNGVVIGGYT